MRGFIGFLAVLCFLALIFSLLFTCVQLVVLDRNFYEREYYVMGTARMIGIDHDELMDVTDKLLDYIEGKGDSLRFKTTVRGHSVYAFDEREREHMVDVRALYAGFDAYRDILAPASLALLLIFALVMRRRDALGLMCKCYIIAASVFAGIFAALAVWMAVDFNSFWNAFHGVAFTNDLWILDPAKSLMINMFPLSFWYDMVTRIVSIFSIITGVLLLICIVYTVYRGYRKRSLLVIKGGRK